MPTRHQKARQKRLERLLRSRTRLTPEPRSTSTNSRFNEENNNMPTGYRVNTSDLYGSFFQAPTAPNQPPAASQKSDKLQALIKELRETSKKLSQEQEEMEG